MEYLRVYDHTLLSEGMTEHKIKEQSERQEENHEDGEIEETKEECVEMEDVKNKAEHRLGKKREGWGSIQFTLRTSFFGMAENTTRKNKDIKDKLEKKYL